MEEEGRDPKITLTLVILIGLLMALLDIITLIPLAGDVVDIGAVLLLFYLSSVGVSGIVYIIGLIIKAIPALQEVPAYSITWWITVGIDRFAPKKVAERLEEAGEIAQKVEGVEGAGKAAEGATAGAKAEAGGGAAVKGAPAGEIVAREGAGAGEGALARGSAEGGAVQEAGGAERGAGAPGGAAEGGPEAGGEATEKARKEAALEREMRFGEEVPIDERLGRELISEPKGVGFEEPQFGKKTPGEAVETGEAEAPRSKESEQTRRLSDRFEDLQEIADQAKAARQAREEEPEAGPGDGAGDEEEKLAA